MTRIVVLAIAVLVATSGCTPKPTVVVFGDSNVAMARAAATPLFGDVDLTWHAKPGYSIDDWATEMAAVPDGATVVVALGSNDLLEHDPYARLDMHNALAVLPDDACVVWVTVNQPSFDQLGLGVEAAGFNDALRAEPVNFPNLAVTEWSTTKTQPTDPVHLTAEGYEQYAAVLAAAPGECRS